MPDYFKKLKQLEQKIKSEMNCTIGHNGKKPNDDGVTETDLTQTSKRKIEIGTSEYRFFKNRHNPKTFTTSLVCLFHERAHLEQIKNLSNDINITSSFLATQYNKYYYRNTNYKNLPFEIDAEQTGVNDAYDYIKENCPELDAFDCIKSYIDYKISKGDARYKDRGFDNCKSIDDINDAFDNVYEKALNKVELDTKNLEYGLLYPYDYLDDDERAKFFENNLLYEMLNKQENPASEYIMRDLLPSGIEQTKFIASYVLYKHPEYKEYLDDDTIKTLSYDNYILTYNEMNFENQPESSRMQKRDKYMSALQSRLNRGNEFDFESDDTDFNFEF